MCHSCMCDLTFPIRLWNNGYWLHVSISTKNMKAQRKNNKDSATQLFISALLTLVIASLIVFGAIFHGYDNISLSLGGDWLNIEMSQS